MAWTMADPNEPNREQIERELRATIEAEIRAEYEGKAGGEGQIGGVAAETSTRPPVPPPPPAMAGPPHPPAPTAGAPFARPQTGGQAASGGRVTPKRRLAKRSCCGCLVIGFLGLLLLGAIESCTQDSSEQTSNEAEQANGSEEPGPSKVDRAIEINKEAMQNLPVQYN